MRCYCCQKRLSNAESTAKFSSGAYTEMCNQCLSTIQEDVTIAEDGLTEEDVADQEKD